MPVTRQRSTGPERRGAIEAKVFDAVERLLAAGESYTRLGVGRIADEAGIARSTFYVHFADKSELLMRVADAATRDLFGAAEEWVAHGVDRDTLVDTAAAIIAQRRAHAPTLAALEEVAAYDPVVATFWRVRIGRFAARLTVRIEDDIAAGRVPAGVDAAHTATWIAWGTERTVSMHVLTDDGDGDRALAHTLARVMWNALYGDA
jgi:AcrR family transcriptional regulator